MALLDYLLFRRDLGLPLSPSKKTLVLEGIDRFGRNQDLALALLAEADPSTPNLLPGDMIGRHAHHMAPLAALHREAGAKDAPVWLADLHTNQPIWRRQFAAEFADPAKSICIVGNAGTICDSKLGSFIDSHDLVVRFNLYRGPKSRDKDIGTRLDLWAMAPGFIPSRPLLHHAPWVAVTGPDVLFRRRNWQPFRQRLTRSKPVVTIPLPIWRDLVAHLMAPPSAGLLVLAWLAALRKDWQNMHAVGFGVLPSKAISYHHADPRHRPTSRHKWEREKSLLQKWETQGLALWYSTNTPLIRNNLK
jgi:hypothetical protein